MTRMAKKESSDGVDYDSLERLLDEIPHQTAYMDYPDLESEFLLISRIFEEGDGSSLYDDEASRFAKHCEDNNRGMYLFPGDGFMTHSNGYPSSGSAGSGYGYGSIPGGSENAVRVRSRRLVGAWDMYRNSKLKLGSEGSVNGGLSTEDDLCGYFNGMGFGDVGVERESELKNVDMDFTRFRYADDPCRVNGHGRGHGQAVYVANGGSGGFRNGSGGYEIAAACLGGYSGSGGGGARMVSPASPGFQKGHVSGNLFQHQLYSRSNSFPPTGYSTLPFGRPNVREQAPHGYHLDTLQSNFSATFNGLYTCDSIYSAPKNRMNFNNGGDGLLGVPYFQPVMHEKPNLNISNELQYGFSPRRARLPLNARVHQGGTQDINREGSFILQGEGTSLVSNKNGDCLRKRMKSSSNGAGGIMIRGKYTHQDRRSKMSGTYERYQNQQLCSSISIPHKIGSLAEIRGKIYNEAKHQTGCRFLQDIIEQRNPQAIQVIFDEIIQHVVELTINPFGNYFMQKLLDVCTEEQRTQITGVFTHEPHELVRVSINDHGTRVVQKLIETASTREQILRIVSALELGFYDLIKDSNGVHVIDRCLQCFNDEDNKFIFVSVLEYCIEIATDQSGCCLLQKCIGHPTGEYRDYLVAEITNNGLFLSQDAYGNYVVQYILELKNPVYNMRLNSQFCGNYVHLALQKCSSHVVEKCLNVFKDYNKSQIIHELLSFNNFEQLVQDPHANYVIQTALKVSEGAIHQRLVEKLEFSRAILSNCPCAKKVFSLMKKK